jgi:hypothetical protein
MNRSGSNNQIGTANNTDNNNINHNINNNNNKISENHANASSKNSQSSPKSAAAQAANNSTAASPLLTNTMVATNESIKLIAESIGISNLSDEAARDLASDLTFIVKSILIVN